MTRRALALSLLEDAGSRGVTTSEFLEAGVGSRYSARILELRRQGFSISSERIRDGSWRYVLVDVGGGNERATGVATGVPRNAADVSVQEEEASKPGGHQQEVGAPGQTSGVGGNVGRENPIHSSGVPSGAGTVSSSPVPDSSVSVGQAGVIDQGGPGQLFELPGAYDRHGEMDAAN